MSKPVIAITMGDAAGVGPEIIMKSFTHPDLLAKCRPLVIGDAARLEVAGRIVGAALKVNRLARVRRTRPSLPRAAWIASISG
ncbi:hypothetical protein GT370_20115 [Acidocella sp. MX-AZ03]|uniref:hypothetical protein n=1 Tax=Acidocella sp. MX-AZ03 TaxID=2697363 RepID=UPI0022DD8BC4|nr:hypothetical protein [Acidocella sp. MX-AZ03]WBO59303.1 hypothetical protein GT370_20115 [Acidocella sp. MX-AZ03]